jgi:hypothetical protein
MEDYQESRMARSSFAGGTSMFGGSQLGASQFGPNYKSMLGDDLAVGGKVNEGPKTIKIGNEEVTMPEKKSLKSVSAKKKANKTQAQLEREKQVRRAITVLHHYYYYLIHYDSGDISISALLFLP